MLSQGCLWTPGQAPPRIVGPDWCSKQRLVESPRVSHGATRCLPVLACIMDCFGCLTVSSEVFFFVSTVPLASWCKQHRALIGVAEWAGDQFCLLSRRQFSRCSVFRLWCTILSFVCWNLLSVPVSHVILKSFYNDAWILRYHHWCLQCLKYSLWLHCNLRVHHVYKCTTYTYLHTDHSSVYARTWPILIDTMQLSNEHDTLPVEHKGIACNYKCSAISSFWKPHVTRIEFQGAHG